METFMEHKIAWMQFFNSISLSANRLKFVQTTTNLFSLAYGFVNLWFILLD